MKALHTWRTEIWKRDFRDSIFPPSGILKDETLQNLSSVGPIQSLIVLERIVSASWPWFGKYGDSLLEAMKEMSIPAMVPKPRKTRAKKRSAGDGGDESAAKRTRVDQRTTNEPAQTPTGPNPTPSHHPYATPMASQLASTTSACVFVPNTPITASQNQNLSTVINTPQNHPSPTHVHTPSQPQTFQFRAYDPMSASSRGRGRGRGRARGRGG